MTPRNIRSFTYKVSPTWLPKHEQNKYNNTDYYMDGGNPTIHLPYTKNFRRQKNAKSGRNKGFLREEHTN